MRKYQSLVTAQVLEAVDKGLSGKNKALPSWLLYDHNGDRIFQTIMHLPEYYLTRCEYEIFETHKNSIYSYVNYDHEPFQLVDLGAGDAYKTQVLIQHFQSRENNFVYVPADVSASALDHLVRRLHKSFPCLSVNPVCAYHEDVLSKTVADRRRVVMLLGSNIGNYDVSGTQNLLRALAAQMQSSDLMLIGFDLKKDPRVIAAAYDDPRGVTKAFNLNLLQRLNLELGANFRISQFSHYPFYDPLTGKAQSFIVSRQSQDVSVEALGKAFHFDEWEPLHTETSQKYDLNMIRILLRDSNLEIVEVFYDERKYFCDVLIRKNSGSKR
jgi:dimethylhistidine N-methyltransferase